MTIVRQEAHQGWLPGKLVQESGAQECLHSASQQEEVDSLLHARHSSLHVLATCEALISVVGDEGLHLPGSMQ